MSNGIQSIARMHLQGVKIFWLRKNLVAVPRTQVLPLPLKCSTQGELRKKQMKNIGKQKTYVRLLISLVNPVFHAFIWKSFIPEWEHVVHIICTRIRIAYPSFFHYLPFTVCVRLSSTFFSVRRLSIFHVYLCFTNLVELVGHKLKTTTTIGTYYFSGPK